MVTVFIFENRKLSELITCLKEFVYSQKDSNCRLVRWVAPIQDLANDMRFFKGHEFQWSQEGLNSKCIIVMQLLKHWAIRGSKLRHSCDFKIE